MAVVFQQVVMADSAEAAPDVMIGAFSLIGEGARLEAGSVLGVGCVLGKDARLGPDCRLGNYVTLAEGVCLGAGTQIGDHTVIDAGTVLGEACFVGSHASLGKRPRPAATSTVKVQADLPPLRLGAGATIGCFAVLYAGTSYGEHVFVGDGARIRERCQIGDHVLIGGGVAVENDTVIGEYTKIQTGSYITAYMDIADRVFIAPMVTTTNDNFMGRTEKRFKLIRGATIEKGARIGGGSILLPGIRIAPETFVAAGALVSKDTRPRRVVKGFPARETREVPEDECL
jgi:UDP-3-O-[3-hydroxymyristoyl] glucosamine N-acyltransferase